MSFPGSPDSLERAEPSGGTWKHCREVHSGKLGVSLPLNYREHLPHGHSWSLIHGRTAYSGNLSVKDYSVHQSVRTPLWGQANGQPLQDRVFSILLTTQDSSKFSRAPLEHGHHPAPCLLARRKLSFLCPVPWDGEGRERHHGFLYFPSIPGTPGLGTYGHPSPCQQAD